MDNEPQEPLSISKSWVLLEDPVVADRIVEVITTQKTVSDIDSDTDGISVISESEQSVDSSKSDDDDSTQSIEDAINTNKYILSNTENNEIIQNNEEEEESHQVNYLGPAFYEHFIYLLLFVTALALAAFSLQTSRKNLVADTQEEINDEDNLAGFEHNYIPGGMLYGKDKKCIEDEHLERVASDECFDKNKEILKKIHGKRRSRKYLKHDLKECDNYAKELKKKCEYLIRKEYYLEEKIQQFYEKEQELDEKKHELYEKEQQLKKKEQDIIKQNKEINNRLLLNLKRNSDTEDSRSKKRTFLELNKKTKQNDEKLTDKENYMKNDKKQNLTGQWYINLHNERTYLRKKEHESDWIFDRAQFRRQQRNKGYFKWMVNQRRSRVKY